MTPVVIADTSSPVSPTFHYFAVFQQRDGRARRGVARCGNLILTRVLIEDRPAVSRRRSYEVSGAATTTAIETSPRSAPDRRSNLLMSNFGMHRIAERARVAADCRDLCVEFVPTDGRTDGRTTERVHVLRISVSVSYRRTQSFGDVGPQLQWRH